MVAIIMQVGAIDVADEICIQKQQIKNEQRGELISLKRRAIDQGPETTKPRITARLLKMVPRRGIEPRTRGFSSL